MRRAGIELAGDISFGGVVGEIEKTAIEEFQGVEYSGYGIGTRHLVTHGVTADFALLAEPTGLRISVANMGCIWLRITVGGTVAHSAHANRPNVVNAIAVMHELQTDIAQWAKRLPGGAHLHGRAAERDGRGHSRRRAVAAVTQSVRVQSLSRYPHRAGPDRGGVKRDLRKVLRGFADRKGIEEPKLHVYVTDPPVLLDEKLPVIEALGAAQQDVTGGRPPSIIRRPGADAVHLTAYGVPCVAFGPGGRMHPDARERIVDACLRRARAGRGLRDGCENLSRDGARPVQPQSRVNHAFNPARRRSP